ncbi:MAG: phosphate/phosphite/phosphonate ABC transporter substrate-binding protein [Thermomonas sp.]
MSLRVLALLGCLLACWAKPAMASSDDPHVLVLGRISDDPKSHYEQLKPLLDYIVPRMADLGIRKGEILMAQNLQQMGSYLRRGRVDWVSETSASGMWLEARAGAVPLLLTERFGNGTYHTVFFARRDAGIRGIDGLRGHSIAFQNTSSTTAYFVPAMQLLERGESLTLLLSPHDRPDRGTVGYLFAGSERNIATWVQKGLVDVGAISNTDWDNPQLVPPAFRPDLKVIGTTPEYPRALEMVRGGLDERIRERLRKLLVEAASDPDASVALAQYFHTTGFAPIDAGTKATLRELQRGVLQVKDEVE